MMRSLRKTHWAPLPQSEWAEDERAALTRMSRDLPRIVVKQTVIAVGHYMAFAKRDGHPRIPDRAGLTAFREGLLATLAPSTVHRYLNLLDAYCRVLRPDRDWSWMVPIYARLRRDPNAPRQKRRGRLDRVDKALKLQEWPHVWRAALERRLAVGTADDPDEAALASALGTFKEPLSPKSVSAIQNSVGLYLAEQPDPGYVGLITPEGVEHFIEATRARVSPLTLSGYVLNLCRFATRTWPEEEFDWLRRVVSALKSEAGRHQTKRVREQIVGVAALMELGRDLLKQGMGCPIGANAAVAVRDAAIILLLCDLPLRRDDLAGLTLGGSVNAAGDGFSISILQGKTGEIAAHSLLPETADALQTYVSTYRKHLLAGRTEDALWIARTGEPLCPLSLSWAIAERTRKRFGRSIPPHAFRTNVGTTLAAAFPDLEMLVSSRLGHTNPESQAPYSAVGRRIGASRIYQDALRRILEDGPPGGEAP